MRRKLRVRLGLAFVMCASIASSAQEGQRSAPLPPSVQFYHADLPKGACIYVPPGNAQYTASGDWGVDDSHWGEYDVSWQEQSCTSTSAGAGGHTQSVSVYALDITVVGPRGVTPWRWQSGY